MREIICECEKCGTRKNGYDWPSGRVAPEGWGEFTTWRGFICPDCWWLSNNVWANTIPRDPDAKTPSGQSVIVCDACGDECRSGRTNIHRYVYNECGKMHWDFDLCRSCGNKYSDWLSQPVSEYETLNLEEHRKRVKTAEAMSVLRVIAVIAIIASCAWALIYSAA